MNVMQGRVPTRAMLATSVAAALVACGGSISPTGPTTPPANRPQLTAPTIDTPVSGVQLPVEAPVAQTFVAVLRSVVVPSPSCPKKLSPQHQTVPSSRRAHV